MGRGERIATHDGLRSGALAPRTGLDLHGLPSYRKAMAIGRAAVKAWVDDRAPSMGAALAYYTLFSLAPLLLIVISIAGIWFGDDAARGEIFGQLQGLVGADGAAAIQSLLESVNKPAGGIAATLFGVVLMLIGATTVFGELQNALDRIWRVPPSRSSGIFNLLRTRLLSFGLILGIGFLMIVSLVVSAVLTAVENWASPQLPGWEMLLAAVNQVLSFALVTVMFAMIYKLMPRARIEWRDVMLGAVTTAVLFSIGKWLISFYIGSSGIGSGFGAAGSLVALLVWIYYSAQIFLLGAEFTWVYAHAHGSRTNEPVPQAQDTA
ncbi:YihY/virulence factor BrkB family protein [Piscinibacter sakaiensis]|uniref:YihY/virulence factor BrkB family protein n=1 Tax=Piscinibacter sakaiensis TaxID=1547922 RepID=UPI003AAF8294